jgi:GT2 family glycosyltransferase
VLYYWRITPGSTTEDYKSKPYANDAAVRALRCALVRRGLARPTDHADGRDGCDVRISDGAAPGTFKIDYKIDHAPKVSILIPFRDQWAVTQRCLDSLVLKSSYLNYEIILIDNGSKDPATREGIEHFVTHHRGSLCLRSDAPFNHSALNNLAARHATGEVLLLLNNDVEIETRDWLEQMLMHVQKPEVGAVGALLLYPSRDIQHAGIILGVGGIAGHAYRGYSERAEGYFGTIHSTINVSAVTGACLMVRKSVYDALQGLDETEFPTSFNDVDFCLRLRERGYRVVYTGHARLLHHESVSRGKPKDEAFRRKMRARWGEQLTRDPFFSPNLSLEWEDFRFGV